METFGARAQGKDPWCPIEAFLLATRGIPAVFEPEAASQQKVALRASTRFEAQGLGGPEKC